MGSAAVKPSLAVSRLLRTRRQERGFTLRRVCDLVSDRGERLPPSTLARIEQGKLDPGVRRLHLLLDVYEIPPHLVADLVELELMAGEPQEVSGDLQTLYSRGVEAWKEGDLSAGLSYLFAVREHIPADDEARILRQKATLGFAIAARNLGKFRLSRQILDDLLCEPPDASLLVNALVLGSSLWRGLGSVEVALALVRQATTHVDARDDRLSAWVQHQEAKLLIASGDLDGAETMLTHSLERYQSLQDTYGEAVALSLRVSLLDKRGAHDRALEAARQLLSRAEESGLTGMEMVGRIEMGRLMVRAGTVEEGLDTLRQGLGQAVTSGDRSAQFLAHYHLWKTYEGLGDRDRARFELEATLYFVRFIDERSPEADEVRLLLKEAPS